MLMAVESAIRVKFQDPARSTDPRARFNLSSPGFELCTGMDDIQALFGIMYSPIVERKHTMSPAETWADHPLAADTLKLVLEHFHRIVSGIPSSRSNMITPVL